MEIAFLRVCACVSSDIFIPSICPRWRRPSLSLLGIYVSCSIECTVDAFRLPFGALLAFGSRLRAIRKTNPRKWHKMNQSIFIMNVITSYLFINVGGASVVLEDFSLHITIHKRDVQDVYFVWATEKVSIGLSKQNIVLDTIRFYPVHLWLLCGSLHFR